MQRKPALIADIQTKILSQTAICFYDKNNHFKMHSPLNAFCIIYETQC